MISVEWHNDEKCENCGQTKPHCAKLHIEKLLSDVEVNLINSSDILDILLCSDCVHELKTRLS